MEQSLWSREIRDVLFGFSKLRTTKLPLSLLSIGKFRAQFVALRICPSVVCSSFCSLLSITVWFLLVLIFTFIDSVPFLCFWFKKNHIKSFGDLIKKNEWMTRKKPCDSKCIMPAGKVRGDFEWLWHYHMCLTLILKWVCSWKVAYKLNVMWLSFQCYTFLFGASRNLKPSVSHWFYEGQSFHRSARNLLYG